MSRAPYPDTPYERIYLQYYGGEEPSEGPAMEVSWCDDKIYAHDVEYVRLESVVKLIEERAKDFEGLPVTEMELTRLAREIRDGAHHREGAA